MSTDKENAENGGMEVEETSNDETSDSKPAVDADVSEESVKSKEKDAKKKAKGKDAKKESKAGDAKPVKEVKSTKVKDEKSDSEEEEEEDDDDDENDENEKNSDGKVPLLDQPLELSGTRERKKVTRFSEEYKTEPKDAGPIEVPEGRGTQLGNIPIIENNIQRTKPESLKPLHRVLFNRVGKSTTLKKNIRKFSGFDFEEESDQYTKKKQYMLKLEAKVLKQICHVLDLKKNLKRDELAESVLNFLMKPEDSGKSLGKPRPKRAARSNNKTYSESDEDEEERKSSRRGKKKHVSLKEVSSDEDGFEDEKEEKEKKDKEAQNASDVKSKGKKDTKGNDSEKDEKDNDSEDEDEKEVEENDDEEEEENSDDSDESKSKSKKGSRSGKNKKQSAKKTNSKKPAPKKAEKKPASKKRAKSDDESSEDEPLSKKSKNPPTDEEIKSYVKEILEGANLEETTMKIVCKKVYAHYPEFDLAHKKDFIKTTVKSLIST